MANWYVKRGTQIAGPLTQQRLVELAAQGKIQVSDLIREGENGHFTQAGQIPGLIPERNSDDWDGFKTETQSQSQPSEKKRINSLLMVIVAVFACGGVLLILVTLILPAVQKAREAEYRSQSKDNMKQIALALHNYHETHDLFPPGGIETTDGKPYHSWQTMILPFIEEGQLHNQIDFDQPWTDPTNKPLFQVEIPLYLNPAIEEKVSPKNLGLSHYVGNKYLMKTNGNMGIRHIKDGTSNTIMAVEVGENFKPWGDPTNIADPVNIVGGRSKPPFSGGSHIMMSDGRVIFVSDKIDAGLLKKLSTPDNGDIVYGF